MWEVRKPQETGPKLSKTGPKLSTKDPKLSKTGPKLSKTWLILELIAVKRPCKS